MDMTTIVYKRGQVNQDIHPSSCSKDEDGR